MKIGIFGGTFNPPHLGHKRLASEMMSTVGLDKLLIIPANNPPHKTPADLLSGEDRMELCRRTFFEPCFDVSDIELRLDGFSYTYYTLLELKKQYPDAEFYLIIGSDMGLSFHKWFRYKDLLSMAHLCLMSRDESVSVDSLNEYAHSVLGLCDGEYVISQLKPYELSSTKIKALFRAGEDVSDFLEPKTYEYIKERGFYL